jgi:hypothetical protein
MTIIINTRADLEMLKSDTTSYKAALEKLKSSMTAKTDTATYPDGYGQAGYTGNTVDPIWADTEDLSSIERLGFTKDEFEALCTAAGI